MRFLAVPIPYPTSKQDVHRSEKQTVVESNIGIGEKKHKNVFVLFISSLISLFSLECTVSIL
jgi:hypothetical protein